MADLETNMRIDFKYSALTLNQYIRVQSEITLLPKSEIKKILTIPDYEVTRENGQLPVCEPGTISYSVSDINIDKFIVDANNENLSISQIAERHNISKDFTNRVICNLRKQGIDIISRSTKTKNDVVAKVFEYLKQGYIKAKISKELNLPYATLVKVIEREANNYDYVGR